MAAVATAAGAAAIPTNVCDQHHQPGQLFSHIIRLTHRQGHTRLHPIHALHPDLLPNDPEEYPMLTLDSIDPQLRGPQADVLLVDSLDTFLENAPTSSQQVIAPMHQE